MGALASNRKRVDQSFSLFSSINSENYLHYSNQIDTRVLKKPKISSVFESPVKITLSAQSAVSRLLKYPEPKQLPREVHAPCRVSKFGCWSSSRSRFRSSASESKEADRMGNALQILRHKYAQAKEQAFSTLYHVEPEPKKEDVVLEYSSDVEIMEDDDEICSVDSQKNKEQAQKLDDKAVENGIILASSSAVSDMTKVEHTEMVLDTLSPDHKYKRMLGNIERSYSDKLRSLKFEIDLGEAKCHSIRAEKSLRKPVETEKTVEDSFHQPFAPLTVEEENDIQLAFSNSNRRRVLVTHENSNIQITGQILQCLRPSAWLNDEVINVYMELLKEREKREPKRFLNCHFFNTFFYKKLIGGRNGYEYKSVRRWTTQRKLGYGLIDCDKIFVPIHKEVHWCLAVINKKDKKFQYLDSLGGIDPRCLKVLARYLVDEVKDKGGLDIDVTSWEHEYVDDLPEQLNGFDCGVFMIKYADFYSRGMGLEFSQENMPYFRLRTAKEILRGKAD